jgi:hypothetical protein
MGRLKLTFYPANPDDRPDNDTFEIELLERREDWRAEDGDREATRTEYRRPYSWYIDINRERDPSENGEVMDVFDGTVCDGVGNLALVEADEAVCRKLVAALHGAVRVEMREAA